MNKHNQLHIRTESGFALMVVIGAVAVVGVISLALWQFRQHQATLTSAAGTSSTTTPTPPAVTPSPTPKPADSADTMANPAKVTSADGKTYFVYGAPAGQNNAAPKKIIVSLPGHGTSADDGYKAWKTSLTGTGYALAEFNWWKGTGEKTTDYYSPAEVVKEARAFLNQQGYSASDRVISHGFSRGSANTYAVIAQDKTLAGSVFDAVISNAGKYQSDFPLGISDASDTNITRLYKNMPWVLVCGGLDPNPTRDGCPGMAETAAWLSGHGANVLTTLTDANQGHGAFHMSSKGLPKQALSLIDAALK